MNRLTQTSTSRFTETAGEAGITATTVFASRNVRHAGIGGVSQEARRYGFPPASFDTGTGDLYLRRFEHDHLAPAHHRPTDYGDERLRNHRFHGGSLRLYREQAASAANKENENDRQALALN